MTLFYTILFSVGDPKQNLYCHMLSLQLAALRRTKTLKGVDDFVVIADPATAAHLRSTSTVLEGVKLLEAPYKPSCLLEGVVFKFLLPKLMDVGDRLCVYLDLDMLAVKQTNYPDETLIKDVLCVYPEGPPHDSNYKGLDPLPLAAGLSSGYFFFRYGPRVDALFGTIFQLLDAQKGKGQSFYTLEQPAFNHAVAAHQSCCRYLDPKTVSFNGNTNQATAHYWNCCGDPGDGPFHFTKMLNTFLRLFVA